MQLNVSGHHIEVTDSLRNYVESKLDRLERHNDRITNMNVILSVEKQRQKAESTIHISGGEVYADAESEDLYAAIDLLADKLDRQLIKLKEKKSDHRVRAGARARGPSRAAGDHGVRRRRGGARRRGRTGHVGAGRRRGPQTQILFGCVGTIPG